MKMKIHDAVLLVKSIGLILLFVFFIPKPLQSLQSTTAGPGNCVVFNTAKAHITFPASNPGIDARNAMSLSFWVKLNSVHGEKADVIALAASNNEGQFWLTESNAVFEFTMQNNLHQKTSVKASSQLKAGTWNKITAVYNGKELLLYINGISEGKAVMPGRVNAYAEGSKLVFGAMNAPGSNACMGNLDEVSLWNIALDEDQVRKIMCRKLSGKEYGLVDYWNFNAASGKIVADNGPGKRTGSMENALYDVSGAPVGDESTYTYSGSSLSFSHPDNGDSLVVDNFIKAPAGIHIYRVDAFPNILSGPESFSGLFANYYFGVFVVNSSEEYDVSWYYKGHNGIENCTLLDMASRPCNSEEKWTALGLEQDKFHGKLTKERQVLGNEYVLGLRSKGFSHDVLDFDAKVGSDVVEIRWSLKPGVSEGAYQVERSTDGIHFEPVNAKITAERKNEIKKYNAVDKKPLKGISYYRLRKKKGDEELLISSLLTVVYPAADLVHDFEFTRAFSNLLSNEIIIGVNCKKSMELGMEILDLAGNVVYSGTFNFAKGSNTINYMGTSLAKGGKYKVSLSDNNNYKTSLRVVQGN